VTRSCTTSKQIVYLALLGNVLVAATKIVAALLTGSAAMMSEAIHSLVDTANEGLLLFGYRMAVRRPDSLHPLGYGRELYFWSFIVALLLFGLGAGVSIYQGIQHILVPSQIDHPYVSYIVLACAFLFEGMSWLAALRKLHATRGELGYWQAIHHSKDPPTFMVLFEDSAALVGIMIAALGIFLSQFLALPEIDGIASVMIGLVLATVASILAYECKSLLIGEPASPWLVAAAIDLAKKEPGVVSANGALTVHLSPDQILLALSVEFGDDLRASQIERCVEGIENSIRAAYPQIVTLFVKPQTPETFERWRKIRYGAIEA
jgi:cation diffusion facilitator family transporter